MTSPIFAKSDTALSTALSLGKPLSVVHFHAEWCEPSKSMFESLKAAVALAKNDGIQLIQVDTDCDGIDSSLDTFGIENVPTVVLLGRDGSSVLSRIDGFDPSGAESNILEHSRKFENVPENVPENAPEKKDEEGSAKEKPSGDEKVRKRLMGILGASDIVLFMKGDPAAPRCGFSRKMIELLAKNGYVSGEKGMSHFDILNDNEIRQFVKEYANFPTFPQLWVKGTLIGGLDICTEIAEDGSLEDEISAALKKSSGVEKSEKFDSLNDRLRSLVKNDRVMLFMKGSPEEPRCGFSRKAVALLNSQGIKFSSFDILSDEEVRQGLKVLFNWKTYPQLYIDGSLIGGIDIMNEMAEDDDLIEAIPDSHKK